nr:uncharacterized protein LOC115257254 [Aedes albopictus]
MPPWNIPPPLRPSSFISYSVFHSRFRVCCRREPVRADFIWPTAVISANSEGEHRSERVLRRDGGVTGEPSGVARITVSRTSKTIANVEEYGGTLHDAYKCLVGTRSAIESCTHPFRRTSRVRIPAYRSRAEDQQKRLSVGRPLLFPIVFSLQRSLTALGERQPGQEICWNTKRPANRSKAASRAGVTRYPVEGRRFPPRRHPDAQRAKRGLRAFLGVGHNGKFQFCDSGWPIGAVQHLPVLVQSIPTQVPSGFELASVSGINGTEQESTVGTSIVRRGLSQDYGCGAAKAWR